MKNLLLISLLLMPVSAWAASEVSNVPTIQADKLDTSKLDPKSKEALDKMMDPQEQALMLCQATQIVKSQTGPNYQPGVDAYGHHVTPADGDGAAPVYTVPDRIDIPLDIAVLQTVGVVTTPTPDLETNGGTISILKDGTVLFNNTDASDTINSYCNTHLNAPTTPPQGHHHQ